MLLSSKKRHLGWLLALASLASGTAAQDKAQVSPEVSCRRFAREFYSWYVPVTQKRLHQPAFVIALERRTSAFAPSLLRALEADWKAEQSAQGDIVGIDFDPFVNSQDPADRYELRNIKLAGDKCSVEVWSNLPHRSSDKSATPDVIAELSRPTGRWQFENFRYPEFNTDLLTLLASLRKERGQQH